MIFQVFINLMGKTTGNLFYNVIAFDLISNDVNYAKLPFYTFKITFYVKTCDSALLLFYF